jgi:hypothetical protein
LISDFSLIIFCKKLFLAVFGIAFLLFTPTLSSAQEKTLPKVEKEVPKDTVVHSPKKAALYSAIVPGLGQVYNKKYWKVPIVYAGLIGLGVNVGLNQSLYNKYREELVQRVMYNQSLHFDPNLPLNSLSVLGDEARKKRDLFIIGSLAFYVLNIVDATVDAHLFSFDVSDDLSIKIQPQIHYFPTTAQSVPGLSLKLKF